MIASTQEGFAGAKLVEKESGSGNVILEKTELEAERQIGSHWGYKDLGPGFNGEETPDGDQKWIEKLCVQNYKIGAVLTEMYTHAEHLQKNTEVKTRLNNDINDFVRNALQFGGYGLPDPCCTGVLEANLNSNVIGVAHIGWISRDPNVNSKGRHNEWGRSVEDLTGVFSVEKFIQLWGNSTCGSISVDWLPCV